MSEFLPDAQLLLRVRIEVQFPEPTPDLVQQLRAHKTAGYLRIVDLSQTGDGSGVSSISCLLTVKGEAELSRSGLG